MITYIYLTAILAALPSNNLPIENTVKQVSSMAACKQMAEQKMNEWAKFNLETAEFNLRCISLDSDNNVVANETIFTSEE